MLISSKVINDSGVQFGTSGARGLVTQFTPDVCAAFTHAFVTCMQDAFVFSNVAIAIDNRPSSEAMALACAQAVRQLGLEVVYYGVVPTPALAYVAMQDNMPAIMVTGSHIPFDRNGLKFYRPDGEISKTDEYDILNSSVEFKKIDNLQFINVDNKAAVKYVERYTSLFDDLLLTGRRIGIYEHSSAGRDLYGLLFQALGAEVIALERSDKFVPIDTEAVSDLDKQKAKKWSQEYNLDFIFSTDGDGDRPLVADENGDWLRGDVLGLLCANALNIEALAVPINCNTAIELCQKFNHIVRTKIGSPYVIDEFDKLAKTHLSIAGFEANGGFLLGTDVKFNNRVIKSLPTRDAVLPALMLLSISKNIPIFKLVKKLPQRFTYSDRIQNFATLKSLNLLEIAKSKPQYFLMSIGLDHVSVENVNTTDGLRMTLTNGDIIHFRPSGNAPELRCYAESNSSEQSEIMVVSALKSILINND